VSRVSAQAAPHIGDLSIEGQLDPRRNFVITTHRSVNDDAGKDSAE
jgi:hypothetical protein